MSVTINGKMQEERTENIDPLVRTTTNGEGGVLHGDLSERRQDMRNDCGRDVHWDMELVFEIRRVSIILWYIFKCIAVGFAIFAVASGSESVATYAEAMDAGTTDSPITQTVLVTGIIKLIFSAVLAVIALAYGPPTSRKLISHGKMGWRVPSNVVCRRDVLFF